MALLLTLQLLFYILVIFPFAVALPVGNSAFSLPNDVSLGFDSSFSFLDGTAQLDPIKREFTKAGINGPRKPLPITTDAKANVLSERSGGPTRPLEKPEEKVNLMTKACEHVVRVDKQEKPQSARRSLEKLSNLLSTRSKAETPMAENELREVPNGPYKRPNPIVELWNKITGKEEEEPYLECFRFPSPAYRKAWENIADEGILPL
ncbi:hypothetical protein Q9L58_004181 [Maublancomyces gigas]|uniref:Uncharacterized protein n=1 Tax=Discina gigas TaxID=1032678 RepID=A0ABR3GLL7_9PEZI